MWPRLASKTTAVATKTDKGRNNRETAEQNRRQDWTDRIEQLQKLARSSGL
jgi:hypothetical protein